MRLSFFIPGLITLIVAWGILPGFARHSFSAHMTMHMTVVALAAPLLAFAIMGKRYDPVCRWPAAWLLAPIPASVIELMIVWGWHAPAPHHFARHTVSGLVLEQGMFLVSGILVWISAFGGSRPRERARTGAGLIGLLLTSMHMTLLGALLALSPRPLYHHPAPASGHGLSPLDDQHLGGAIMLAAGGIAYLLGGLFLTRDLLRKSPDGTKATLLRDP